LAKAVVTLSESHHAQFRTLYEDDLPLWDKIESIAQNLYGADEIIADQKVRNQIKALQTHYGHFPICMAKTQYSFSTDPRLRGAPNHHSVPIREVRLANGAGFIVVICGDIMTMPGLPRTPAANNIRLNDHGEVEGLF
jgi:formate--tetrahydrofolate ligase